PLLNKSNEILKQVNNKISKDKTIIGVGGIDSWESANQKFKNGADLIQLYTGLVYKGPSVIRDILKY
ncbi:MAG: quinone-dependent dihydroorotate dehydrogenase, partial [Gammaproteobacteria bacterium]